MRKAITVTSVIEYEIADEAKEAEAIESIRLEIGDKLYQQHKYDDEWQELGLEVVGVESRIEGADARRLIAAILLEAGEAPTALSKAIHPDTLAKLEGAYDLMTSIGDSGALWIEVTPRR